MSEQRTKGPASFGEIAKDLLTAGAPRLSEAEQDQVEAEADAELGDTPDGSPLAEAASRREGEPHPVIARVKVPTGLAIPPYKQIGYFLFRPELTERPDIGNRTCMTWGLTVAEERLARSATRGDSSRTYEEMTKFTIRCMDGVKADWTGAKGPGSVNRFWDEIGPKARSFLINSYLRTHTPTAAETADFFFNCTTYMTSVVGQ